MKLENFKKAVGNEWELLDKEVMNRVKAGDDDDDDSNCQGRRRRRDEHVHIEIVAGVYCCGFEPD